MLSVFLYPSVLLCSPHSLILDSPAPACHDAQLNLYFFKHLFLLLRLYLLALLSHECWCAHSCLVVFWGCFSFFLFSRQYQSLGKFIDFFFPVANSELTISTSSQLFILVNVLFYSGCGLHTSSLLSYRFSWIDGCSFTLQSLWIQWQQVHWAAHSAMPDVALSKCSHFL